MITYAIGKAVRQFRALGLHYTERQLYYETCRLLLPWWRYLPIKLAVPVAWPRFTAALARLQARGVVCVGLLPAPELQLASIVPRDLQLFGLPRVLLCSDAHIAAMLDANGLALELGCPVVNVAQACPLPSPMAQMLQRAGGRVYLLHNANTADVALGAELGSRLQLPEGIGFTALGLRPAHALRLRLFVQREREAGSMKQEAAMGASLSPKERRWLAGGRSAELAALPPLRLLRAMRRLLHPEVPTPSLWVQLRRWPQLGYMSWPCEGGL